MNATDRLQRVTADFELVLYKGEWVAIPRTVAAGDWCKKLGVIDLGGASPYVLRALIEANGMTVEG